MIHLKGRNGRTACGKRLQKGQLTDFPSEVTCFACDRVWDSVARKGKEAMIRRLPDIGNKAMDKNADNFERVPLPPGSYNMKITAAREHKGKLHIKGQVYTDYDEEGNERIVKHRIEP